MTDDEITQVRVAFSKIQFKVNLAELINWVGLNYLDSNFHSISITDLDDISIYSKNTNLYKSFEIAKKSGGTRQIHAPRNDLKQILKCLNKIFQCLYETNLNAYGFIPNRSILDNAKLHSQKKYVFNSDLKDFFHSFDFNRLKHFMTKAPFNLNKEKQFLAHYLALICTQNIEIEGITKRVLPQGSPTSPTLTNIICIHLDRRLNGLAKKYGAIYSRYADDITISCNQNIFNQFQFKKEFHRIIEIDQNLLINPKKTRIQKNNFRQEVTGLTVNEKVNVPKRYVKQLRMWIYYWEQYGYHKASDIFRKDYKKDKGHIKGHNSNLRNVLSGKLQYLKMIKGHEDECYKKLQNRFTKLSNK